jgi:hypothetical protein
MAPGLPLPSEAAPATGFGDISSFIFHVIGPPRLKQHL